jgi:hypothetical protein
MTYYGPSPARGSIAGKRGRLCEQPLSATAAGIGEGEGFTLAIKPSKGFQGSFFRWVFPASVRDGGNIPPPINQKPPPPGVALFEVIRAGFFK